MSTWRASHKGTSGQGAPASEGGEARAAGRELRRLVSRDDWQAQVRHLLLSASQVFVGIKCISFEGTWHESRAAMTLQGALRGGSVVLINAEAWLANRIVHALTAEEGFLVPEFHPHPLYFQDTLLHHCDMCRAKTW